MEKDFKIASILKSASQGAGQDYTILSASKIPTLPIVSVC